jgi:hypothetical protein
MGRRGRVAPACVVSAALVLVGHANALAIPSAPSASVTLAVRGSALAAQGAGALAGEPPLLLARVADVDPRALRERPGDERRAVKAGGRVGRARDHLRRAEAVISAPDVGNADPALCGRDHRPCGPPGLRQQRDAGGPPGSSAACPPGPAPSSASIRLTADTQLPFRPPGSFAAPTGAHTGPIWAIVARPRAR